MEAAPPDAASSPDDRLAHALAALAVPTRLALLRALRLPQILAEIEVKPSAPGPVGSPARNLARQTVRQHLDLLLDVGLVRARNVERGRGETTAFVVNHQAIFALAEELRDLARLRPAVEPSGETAPAKPAAARGPSRPCLVLAKGLDEGTSWDLHSARSARRRWTLGRSRACDIALDFDPYVSAEHAHLVWDGASHVFEDLPASRNTTTHNLRPVAKGERVTLAHGDLIGVGRSMLVYWA